MPKVLPGVTLTFACTQAPLPPATSLSSLDPPDAPSTVNVALVTPAGTVQLWADRVKRNDTVVPEVGAVQAGLSANADMLKAVLDEIHPIAPELRVSIPARTIRAICGLGKRIDGF
jgi:hypothetical protein